jgi:GPH family glycoside/pentoside/hexuronide:cation symporter
VLWTVDQNEQTRIAAMRESFGLIGLILAVTLPSILQHFFPREDVYRVYASVLVGMMTLAVCLFITMLQNQTQNNKTPDTVSLSPFVFVTQLPKVTLRLLCVYGLSMFASSIPAVLVVFYVRDLLNAEHLIGVFLAAYFLSGAASTPFWTFVSRKFGKYQAWCAATLLAVCSFIGAFFLSAGDVSLYLVICIVSGFALGADLTLTPSLLSDQIHAREHQRYSGTYFALMSFTAKAGLALASATALTCLDYAGFRPQAVNDPASLLALSTSYALIPCVLKLLSAAFLYAFFIRPPSGGYHVTH